MADAPSNPPRLRLRVTAAAESAVRDGHPWVYDASVREQNRAGQPGELAVLYDRRDKFLALGLYDPLSPIRVRVLHAGKPVTADESWWRARLQTSLARRAGLFDAQTTGYRCLSGESDGWPGLVLDRYATTFVLKLYSAVWLPRVREIIGWLSEALPPLVGRDSVASPPSPPSGERAGPSSVALLRRMEVRGHAAHAPPSLESPPPTPVGRDSVEPHLERSEASAASISGDALSAQDARSARADSVGQWGSTESHPTGPSTPESPAASPPSPPSAERAGPSSVALLRRMEVRGHAAHAPPSLESPPPTPVGRDSVEPHLERSEASAASISAAAPRIRLVLRLSRNIQTLAEKDFHLRDGQVLLGDPPAGPIVFLESGIRFEAEVIRGQKTGFFLDQRENRRRVETLAAGRDVLNAFSFSGGFSLYAARGGARSTTDLDISPHALDSARRNFALNAADPRIAACRHECAQADTFDWLAASDRPDFDLVILDPPSLAKRETERAGAIQAYRKLAVLGLPRLRRGGILVAASCSAHVSTAEFFGAVLDALHDSGRPYTELLRTTHAPDHPATFPEAQYLKCLFVQLEP